MIDSGKELLRQLPWVLRARDFHLYLEGGKRLLDLWLSGGRALLGHKPPRVLGELKNSSERGLFAPFPHPLERRFFKALECFFPNRIFRLYEDRFSLCRALDEAGIKHSRLLDPAFPEQDTDANGIHLWRPFLEKLPSVFIPVLPWQLGPDVLVLKRGEEEFPPGDLIPPVLLAPAVRSLYELAKIMKAQSILKFGKIERALVKSRWRRKGIYLTLKPDIEKAEYETLFKCFLEGGFLIPPSSSEPAIIPFEMSPGEEAKLAQLLSEK